MKDYTPEKTKTRKVLEISYEEIISIENLLCAFKEFRKGKSGKKDIQEFEFRLMENILKLHEKLKNKTYTHGSYQHFKVQDPKERDIHKAQISDRVLHHAVYRKLYPFFGKLFIADSYSCRNDKGTHKAMNRFKSFSNKVSKNYTKPVFVLKCDIKKFFANIDHRILINILDKRIADKNMLNLLENIIKSFKVGLPLGNLTSQLLVNIYMNEFDQFVKHGLNIKYYIRYADDFVFLNTDKLFLEKLIPEIDYLLKSKLKLELHPNKVYVQSIYSGVDFLGFVHFKKHRILRTATKKRMFRKLKENNYKRESVTSYLGLIKHGDTFKLQVEITKNTDRK